MVSCCRSLRSLNVAPFSSGYTSSPASLNGVPSGNSPIRNDQMLVSRCLPSTTSKMPDPVSWKNMVGMGTFSSSDSTSRLAVRTVHTNSRW